MAASTERHFVGLSNQGATCYMNSLLQTLYMTPEFRHSLYQWRYDPAVHGDEQDCIPLQLQRLFGQLQLSDRVYVDTTALTRSFQWDWRDSFLQHDAQEFCRVLFDAIEDSVKQTPQARFINELYEGSLVDFVKCLSCGVESRREDKFMDLSLTVRSEFQQSQTLEAALANFLRTEQLTDDNQYFCSHCQSKQDASKGLKFAQLPYVLVLQLKRFDLDFKTMQRVKLNDPVKFPLVLDMEPFMAETPPQVVFEESSSEDSSIIVPPEISRNFDKIQVHALSLPNFDRVIADEDKTPLKMDPITLFLYRERELAQRKAEKAALIEMLQAKSSHVYELFSVMVHSGSALGGHYYAYILDFASGRWFDFNDSYVNEVDLPELETVHGSNASYAATAYLLMYRKVDPRNLSVVDKSKVPDYVTEYILQYNETRAREAKEHAERLLQLQIPIYFRGKAKLIITRKDFTLHQLKLQALEAFQLTIDEEDCRLRAYSESNDLFKETYTGREYCFLDALNFTHLKTLALEDKLPHEEFIEYDPDALNVKVQVWDDNFSFTDSKLEFKLTSPLRLQVQRDCTIYGLMEALDQLTSIPAAEIRLYKRSPILSQTRLEEITRPDLLGFSLLQARVFESTTLYCEANGDVGRWQEEFETDANRIILYYNIPDAIDDYTNCLLIDRRRTVADLRNKIALKFSIDPMSFIMKRSGSNGLEIKNLQASLMQSSLIHNGLLHLTKGNPALPGQYRLMVCIAEFMTNDPDDSSLYRFFDLISLNAHAHTRILDLKAQIAQIVHLNYPTLNLNPQKMRLRERYQERLGAALHWSCPLSYYNLYDNKQVAVQVLAEEDSLAEDETIVVTRWWSPSNWKLSEAIEITVEKGCSISSLATKLSSTYNFPVRAIQSSQLAVFRVTYQNLLDISDLIDERWHCLSKISGSIAAHPLFIGVDGLELV